MRRLLALSVCVSALTLWADTGLCAVPLQRFLLVAGANHGGADRATLRYAVSDAERFARVLVDLGGVNPANEIVLKEPGLREFQQALDTLSARVGEARRAAAANGGGRIEVLVYYSGHADEKGLLLGEDRYSYQTLRDRLDQIPGDVRIAVLDACASGAFIRIKGGKTRPAFLVDESSSMRGHAFLTSSSETETAQESDRVGASYFTHYLVSGLRGAADMSGDGKVTLNEAYQFAFNETLGRTQQTRGGAQHPSYDITMSGSGDVVMTDVRQTSATLVLGEEVAGRFFIRNSSQQLVVELYKPAGRKVELGLEPGGYEVRLERENASLLARAQLPDRARVLLDPAWFQVTQGEPMRRRGLEAPMPKYALSGRNRLEFRIGFSPASSSATSVHSAAVVVASSTVGVGGGLDYARYFREDWTFTFGFDGFAGENSVIGYAGDHSSAYAVVAFPFGVRWNPLGRRAARSPIKPYAVAAVGPAFVVQEVAVTSPTSLVTVDQTTTVVNTQLGAGADFHVARWFSIGLTGAYNWYSGSLGDAPNGFQMAVGFGFLFGKGDAR